MIKYKKLKIKNEKDIEELDIDDIESLDSFGDIRFKRFMHIVSNAITFSFLNNPLKHKVAKLSQAVDWTIREYEGELYLIALKKDC